MTNSRRIAVLISLIVGVVAAGTSMLASRGQSPKAAPTGFDKDTHVRQENVARASGLHEAAKLTGHYVGFTGYPNVGGPADLAELIDVSPLIVVGTVVENVSRSAADGRTIVTLYSIHSESVFKGHLRSDRLSMILPGGRVRFADGTEAELRTSGLRRPRTGEVWAWFARSAPEEFARGNETFIQPGGAFVPVAGALGAYELSGRFGAYVGPAGYPTSPLSRWLHQRRFSREDFLDELRRLMASR
jgi:hypothetical protein